MGRRYDDETIRQKKKVRGEWPKKVGGLKKIGGIWCIKCHRCGYIEILKQSGAWYCPRCPYNPFHTYYWLTNPVTGEPA